MEKCKYCQAELAANGTFCPNCGKNNAEVQPVEEAAVSPEEAVMEEAAAEAAVPEEAAVPAQEVPAEEKKQATPGKIALAIAAVVVLAAILIALITAGTKDNKAQNSAAATEPAATVAAEETIPATVPADGNPEDITCKGTYTVTDAEAEATKDTVVATIGEHQLTNAQLRIYYRSAMSSFLNTEYGYYMMMYGMLDYTKPLDTQLSTEGEMTWQQYFLQSALENWQLTKSMALEAEKAGLEVPQEDLEYLEGLRASLETTAAGYGLSVEDMLLKDFGVGVSYEVFEEYQKLYLIGNPYYEAETAKLVPTEEDLEAYFAAHEEDYASSGITKDSKYVDVRHILVQVKGGFADTEGNMTHTDEEWAECEAAAQAILDAWLAGDKTEDSFAALANEKSEDPGSNTTGGLYENVYQGQMVEPFETWCFDESRQYGDYGLVKTSYGYHVMFYVGSEPMWKTYAESGWINEKTGAFLDAAVESYPMEVTYENITLGDVSLA
nr:peptidylprolyl isomerase [Oscillospiraceae bacterium]